ncbi:IS4 family transposase [Anaerosolibacter sp.]|uniref:IS4 family transposase n=1 Tax=Anaerosolibacter sp. TaxID=1872527 RepID=UPI0039EF6278
MILSSEYKEKPTDFTRKRKIGFKGILVSILTSLKRSLSVEIDQFIKKLDVEDTFEYTKQAYSQARQNLKPEAFIELNNVILEETYNNHFKTFNNYRLIALDGSTIQLPNTKEMRDRYGVFIEGRANYPAARICLAYDVLNEIILAGKMFSYNESEQIAPFEIIPMIKDSNVDDIFIFDRGFPSVKLILLLNSLKKDYIFRVSSSFLREVNEFTKGTDIDKTITIDISKRRIATHRIKDINEPVQFDLRCIRIPLETEDEILITSLGADVMNVEDFKALYNLRWNIETKYNSLKNVLELENFTGDTDRAIQQDFYASIYISNLASMMVADAQDEYDKNQGDKQKKHEYKINQRMAIAYLKNDLINILLQDDPHKASKLYEKFVKKLSKQVVPIRKDRKFERPKGHKPKYGRTNKKIL